MDSLRYRIISIVLAQIGLLLLLLGTTRPLVAAAGVIAIHAALMIVLYPRLGIYVIATLLIGHWPWGIMRYLGMLTVASSGLWLIIHRRRLFPPNVLLIIVTAFMGFVFLSAIRPQTRVELISSVLQYGGNCALIWLFVTLVSNRQRLITVVWCMVFAGVMTALIGLVQWRTHFVWIQGTARYGLEMDAELLDGKTAFDLQSWQGQFRIDSITGTQDFLPLSMQCLMPFVAFWTIRQSSWLRRFIGLGTLLLFGFVHILSFTRGAILTTAFVLTLLGWTIDRRRFLVFGIPVALIGFMALMTWAPWRERVITIITLTTPGIEEDHLQTGVWRLRSSVVGLQMIADHPFLGVGVGQQQWNWPDSAIGVIIPEVGLPNPIHNSYLRMGIELGIGGLIVVLTLIGTTLFQLHRVAGRFRRLGDTTMADMSTALLIAFAGIALAMLIYPLIFNFRYFWLLVALASGFVQYENELSRAEPTRFA